jgi:hypothetical protein
MKFLVGGWDYFPVGPFHWAFHCARKVGHRARMVHLAKENMVWVVD